MLTKRKSFLLLGVLALAGVSYAEDGELTSWEDVKLNYELKVGVTPYEKYGSKTYSNRYDEGLDFGLEVYRPFENFSIGFGGEVKRKLDKEFIREDGERLYTYYLLAKRKIWGTYSLVARLGRTSQKEFDSTYYVAAGLEKRFGRFTVQLLGENTKLKNNFADKDYTTIGLKFGYIFGDISEPELNQPILPTVEPRDGEGNTQVPVVTAAPEPKFKLVIAGDEITGGYEAYKTYIPEVQKMNVQEMTKQLNDYDKPGVLEMTAYSDNTGSKELNVKLATERMNNLEQEFINNGLTDKVRIEKVNPEETVMNVYKVDNDTFENRKLNRRIEVSFYEDEEVVANDDGKIEEGVQE